MAKRKKKDPLSELLGYVFPIVFICVFLYTDSIWMAISIVFGVSIAILIVLKIKHVAVQKKINQSGILEVDKMTGEQFEEFLKLRYEKLGYKVELTPKTGDFGADLVLYKESQKIVVQAKRYSRTVGIKAIQEINSAKPHYNAAEAWAVTNNYYTKAAKELAASNQVRLIDRDDLIQFLLA